MGEGRNFIYRATKIQRFTKKNLNKPCPEQLFFLSTGFMLSLAFPFDPSGQKYLRGISTLQKIFNCCRSVFSWKWMSIQSEYGPRGCTELHPARSECLDRERKSIVHGEHEDRPGRGLRIAAIRHQYCTKYMQWLSIATFVTGN